MRIEKFEMERMQNLYESEVEFNLSVSGVMPLSPRDLLDGKDEVEQFLSAELFYSESTGSGLLRERIAGLYPGCLPENVTVTNGTSEANYVTLWTLLEANQRMACMLPNYLQAWGIGRAYAAGVDPFHLVLREESGQLRWALDLDELERAVTRQTRVIFVNTPNNPTGAILNRAEMDAVVAAARRVNAWLVVDEVYRGAELEGDISPSFWGMYEKVVVTCGMSKAFALPGLRLGWVVAPVKLIEEVWVRHDYLTLTPGLLSDRLATLALEPTRHAAIRARIRTILQNNLPHFEAWIEPIRDVVRYVRPQAGAIAYFGYHGSIPSALLAERLHREGSVLVVPGEYFGLERGFRIGYGMNTEKMKAGLARLQHLMTNL